VSHSARASNVCASSSTLSFFTIYCSRGETTCKSTGRYYRLSTIKTSLPLDPTGRLFVAQIAICHLQAATQCLAFSATLSPYSLPSLPEHPIRHACQSLSSLRSQKAGLGSSRALQHLQSPHPLAPSILTSSPTSLFTLHESLRTCLQYCFVYWCCHLVCTLLAARL
jgi:hypothetical protein